MNKKKGIESLTEAVKKDCSEGQGCFNPNGCNHEFTRMEPETNPALIKLGMTTCCRQVSKCAHKYCDKFKWILDRAQQYANALDVSYYEVIQAWEEDRTYWYNNYYQECNQPSLNGNGRVIKLIDWMKELKARFGENPDNWKFVCPVCGHVQSVGDFKAIGADPDRAYSNCIGRVTGSNDSTGKKGCNYTINGLISLNKTTVISDKYLPVKVFEMAD